MRKLHKSPEIQHDGFILATLLAFVPLLAILATIAISVGLQANQTAIFQQYKEQAQLASTAAMDFAKEQYELDVNYLDTPETELYITDQYRVTYEVVHDGYSNALQTQQDIRGIGRVYKLGDTTPRVSREIQGKITYTAGAPSSVRFIFIIDNSGSMSTSEWLDSKSTVDAAIEYVLENVSTAEVAVVQYGTAGYDTSYNEHKYDVTVPFTGDLTTATTWDRRYGNGSTAYWDRQDHLPGSLARMRLESVYGAGDELDLAGATDIQYVLFTDAMGDGFDPPWQNSCCSSLKRLATDPTEWHDDNGSGFTVANNYGEYNMLKDGTVYAEDGYPGLTSQFTVLSIEDDPNTQAISAALASPGGNWVGAIDSNTGDPEGDGFLPRRFISTSLAAGPAEIIDLLAKVIEDEINF
jgi:type II secretory pathway pseudopilin PulG